MKTPLVASALISFGLFGVCLTAQEPSADPKIFGLLAVLALLSDIVALPVPQRGFLSNSFLWIFLMAQFSSLPSAAVVLVGSLTLRFAILAKSSVADRVLHMISETLPALAALVVMRALSGPADHGFPRGLYAAVLSILVYYVVGILVLKQLYTVRAGPDRELLERATRSRQLQMRLNAVLALAATQLADGGLARCLWVVPVILGVHQFFWEKLEELKRLSVDGALSRGQIKFKETQLEAQSQKLHQTKDEKDLIERCLEEFSASANLKQTASSILHLASEIKTASNYVLFWNSEAGFGPLLALNALLEERDLDPKTFPDRSLLNRSFTKNEIVSASEGRCWCFPLHSEGLLYLGDMTQPPSEAQKRNLALLARQGSFGLRSAFLFEELNRSMALESIARTAAEQAADDLKLSQTQLIESSRMAAVGQLAAGVAHELNSPLAAILVAVQAGQRSLGKGNLDRAAARFTQCEEAVEKAKIITNGLLTQSRRSDGNVQRSSVRCVVEETCQFLSERIKKSGVHWEIVPGEDPQATLNSSDISQILTNLLLNAQQAITDANRGEKKITVEVSTGAHEIFIDIADTGPGIPPEHRERIFEPFFTTKTRSKGTGLGLHLSSEIVARNGGSLALLKSDSGGSTFRLTLPKSGT